MDVIRRKKLIEVALPLDDINAACAHEKLPGIGAHPRGLHLWWARRPFASARAVIFAQMVDDPSAVPEEFPTAEAQQTERERLFQIIRDFVPWKNAGKQDIIERAREEIRRSWHRCCEDNKHHPQADELFNPDKLPAFHDPFAGGGALPLEAQRLGLESHASDLNPIPVLINKAMIEIPPQFTGLPPVNPESNSKATLLEKRWEGVEGLIADIEYYGNRIYEKAVERMGHLYPDVHVTEEMVKSRPDLAPYKGQDLEVLTYIWARTVKSPNPAYAHVDVPLISTYWLCSKKGKEVYLEPVIEGDSYRFEVRIGKPTDVDSTRGGTKPNGRGQGFECLMSGTPMPFDLLREKAKKEGLGDRLIAVVCKGKRGKVYINADDYVDIQLPRPALGDVALAENPRDVKTRNYGMGTVGSLFNARQLNGLLTFCDLIEEVVPEIEKAAKGREFGETTIAYPNAVRVYLSFVISRLADYNSTLCRWKGSGEQSMQTYGRHALPMTWDYTESNLIAGSAVCWKSAVKLTTDALGATAVSLPKKGFAQQRDAQTQEVSRSKVISTDPPYYDNIGYADLSDFFYVWQRRNLKAVYPDFMGTIGVPKAEELIASPYRHGSTDAAEEFFMDGMGLFIRNIIAQVHPAFPVTIYYAFKQKEIDGGLGEASTGWETFIDAVVRGGFQIQGTWPVRTEQSARLIGRGTNALSSSVVLVCNRRAEEAPSIQRKAFVEELKETLPEALEQLVAANTAPVDMAQAAIGPGMAVYSKYSSIMKVSGERMEVREALALINEVLDETLSSREADYDEDTRFAVAWFSQYGFEEAEFGVADSLARAKNTSVEGAVLAGIANSSKGRVKLMSPKELPAEWDPRTDGRLTMWERTNHLVRALMEGGDTAAAILLQRMGASGAEARELAYQLYNICEKKKWANEALGYNALIQGWPEIEKLSRSASLEVAQTGELDFGE